MVELDGLEKLPGREEPKPMTSALPLTPLRRPSPITLSTTSNRLPPSRRSVSITARSHKTDNQHIGGAIALASNTPLENTSNKLRSKEREPKIPEPKDDDKRQLSGADVLWAIQRAAAQKAKKKKAKRQTVSRDSNFAAREIKRTVGNTVDYSSVKPLCIKSEWSDRLEELERQLQELMDT